jgi:hypothetical protein
VTLLEAYRVASSQRPGEVEGRASGVVLHGLVRIIPLTQNETFCHKGGKSIDNKVNIFLKRRLILVSIIH